jgi:hypothetical protein
MTGQRTAAGSALRPAGNRWLACPASVGPGSSAPTSGANRGRVIDVARSSERDHDLTDLDATAQQLAARRSIDARNDPKGTVSADPAAPCGPGSAPLRVGITGEAHGAARIGRLARVACGERRGAAVCRDLSAEETTGARLAATNVAG